jgi:predicted nucleotidyltransferase
MKLTADVQTQIVDAIRSEIEPAAIILFGSYARGEATPASDIDLLVLRRDDYRPGESRRDEIGRLYRTVSRVCAIPKDILLFSLAEFHDWKDTTNHMLSAAAREGHLLYGEV